MWWAAGGVARAGGGGRTGLLGSGELLDAELSVGDRDRIAEVLGRGAGRLVVSEGAATAAGNTVGNTVGNTGAVTG
eukprot:SAG11_NODE_17052_length_530_cov_0.665893_1_plen_76_part_00